jgi:hypothetical protein
MKASKAQICSAILLVSVGSAGCRGVETGTPGAVASPPSRRGDIWEIQTPADRTSVPGSIVAFVNGVHVMVVDGDQIYAGMTTVATKNGFGGRCADRQCCVRRGHLVDWRQSARERDRVAAAARRGLGREGL